MLSFSSRFCFMRLFWNQILICRSVSWSCLASSIRRSTWTKLQKWNSFSSSRICAELNTVRWRSESRGDSGLRLISEISEGSICPMLGCGTRIAGDRVEARRSGNKNEIVRIGKTNFSKIKLNHYRNKLCPRKQIIILKLFFWNTSWKEKQKINKIFIFHPYGIKIYGYAMC